MLVVSPSEQSDRSEMSSSTVEDEETMLPVDVHVDEDAVTGAEADGIKAGYHLKRLQV